MGREPLTKMQALVWDALGAPAKLAPDHESTAAKRTSITSSSARRRTSLTTPVAVVK